MIVLIAEDDENVAELLRRAYAEYVPTWTVSICRDMRTLLDHLNAPHDLIVLDLALPDSPTEKTVDLIGLLCDTAPVIVLTGKEVRNSGIDKRCYALGADSVWEKSALHNGGCLYFVHACNCAIERFHARP